MAAKQIQKKKDQLFAGEKAFNQLQPREKAKILVCSKWNFYSRKCRTCQYELICVDQWQVRDYLEKTKK